MYLPVVVQWLLLALRHRSLTLPLLANPRLPLAGMVGVSKHQLMSQARGRCRTAILPWVQFQVGEGSEKTQVGRCLSQAREAGIELPFVCKPDIGCRGAGGQTDSLAGGTVPGDGTLPRGQRASVPEAGELGAGGGHFLCARSA